MADDIELRRRRAAYRASHRGTKEMDLILGRFANARLGTMSAGELASFERMIALPDPVLAGYFSQADTPAEPEFATLMEALRRFHGLEEVLGGTPEKTE